MTQKPAAPKTRAVTYLRVSTRKQGATGLGIEAQRTAAKAYADRARLEIVGEYVEVESGRKRNRPILQQAINSARINNARLVVAKLDRLARDANFLFALRDSGCDFVAADNPDVGPLVVGILAVIAQDEADRIKARIIAALKEAKLRGTKLGRPENMTAADRARGPAARHIRALADYNGVSNYARLMRNNGATLAEIAVQLNADGHKTSTGKPFHAMTISRILARIGVPRKPRRELRSMTVNPGVESAAYILHGRGMSFEAVAAELNQNGLGPRPGAQFTAKTVERLLQSMRKRERATATKRARV